MISAIGAHAVSNPILVRGAASSNDAPSTELSLAGTTRPVEADVLSLSRPESLATGDGFHQSSSLKIRSHSRVRVTDDGQVRTKSHTKLRFRYDFEAADGTKIRIRAKANLHYSQRNDSEGGLQSTRFRAKARVSVLQEGVSTGIAPLLERPEVSSEAKDGISQAIDHFLQITDAVASLFLDSDPVDGDELIAGLIEAFNELSESLDSIFLLPPADPETAPSGEVVELLGQTAADPGEVPTAEPVQIVAVPALGVESDPLSRAPTQVTAQASEPESELVENVDPKNDSALENEVLPKVSEQEEAGESQDVGPANNEQSQSFLSSVMFRVRLQVIQSLTSLVGDFESDSPSLLASHSMFKAQFAARYEFSGLGLNDSSSHNSQIDTQV